MLFLESYPRQAVGVISRRCGNGVCSGCYLSLEAGHEWTEAHNGRGDELGIKVSRHPSIVTENEASGDLYWLRVETQEAVADVADLSLQRTNERLPPMSSLQFWAYRRLLRGPGRVVLKSSSGPEQTLIQRNAIASRAKRFTEGFIASSTHLK
jgi:hypothetical protein